MATTKAERPAPQAPAPVCRIKTLPDEEVVAAAERAIALNPANEPPLEQMRALAPQMEAPDRFRLAVLTAKKWPATGVDLTVGFMEQTAVDLRERILSHLNAWNARANVRFRWTQTSPQVRITRADEGYWSYLGTDVLSIPAREATMCLSGFTMSTSEGEWRRVVRHEAGHTLGFPHEQQLPEIVALLDVAKTIAWGRRELGWDEAMVRSQILTPLAAGSFRMSAHADKNGIMCYSLPASITKNGQPIPGGDDIDEIDHAFAATIYPKDVAPPPPPPPGGGDCATICEAVRNLLASGALSRGPATRQLLHAFNRVRPRQTNLRTEEIDMAEPLFTPQDLGKITEAARALAALPCDQITDILTRLTAFCPPQAAPQALPCAGLLSLLCPQLGGLFQPQPLLAPCAGIGGLITLITQLGPLIQQLGPIIAAIQAACPPAAGRATATLPEGS